MPVAGQTALFPVRRVYCVGQNYAAHALEMGADPSRDPPFFFCKSREAVHTSGEFPYPTASADVQFEIEMVVALSGGGHDLRLDKALEAVFGYAVGLDMTRRDLQAVAKKSGRPWEAAKAFHRSAPCSPIVPVAHCGHPERGRIWLNVNGVRRQSGDLQQMIWKVPEILAQLSRLFPLSPGDLIFTGTPSGVGPIAAGDRMSGGVEGVSELEVGVR